jgi:hypothetical protein
VHQRGVVSGSTEICLLQSYGMLCCKTISTPMDPNVSPQEDQGKELDDVTIYRQLVKSLIYLTLT